MADIVNRIPYELSNFGGSGVGGSYALQDVIYDYAIGGVPFLSATRDDWPYTEQMAQIRKDQFDNFAEPGEQSLQGWWLRSQSKFTGGAGVLYQDPDNDNEFNIRFADSLGIDPWVSGEIKLLRDSSSIFTSTTAFQVVRGFSDPNGLDATWMAEGGNIFKYDETNGNTPMTGIADIGTIHYITSTGYTYFLITENGVWTGEDSATPTQIYSFTSTDICGEFVKARLVVGVDNTLYELPLDPASPPVALTPASSEAFYTHPDANWRWTSITEGPNAIYAAGHSGTTGMIFKFQLTSTGDIPSLTGGGVITSVMPAGETINTIYGYISTFVGIATNKGFRVGQIDSNGDINYGPLLFQPTGGCSGIVGFDRFMWTGSQGAHDGASGLFRIDLGTTIQEQTTQALRYAYARDVYVAGQTGSIQSITMFGNSDRLVWCINAYRIMLQSVDTLLSTGYMKTGRIRFNTTEPKLYKFFSIRTPPLQGSLRVSLLDQGGGETTYITYSPTYNPGQTDVSTPRPVGPQSWIALKFTLNRSDTDTSKGAIMNEWQVKALPGSIRQRMINHTFLLFDDETDKGGQRNGYDGYARDRLNAFQEIARKGDVTVFQELQEDLSVLVVIDDWKYTQLSPPGADRAPLGGYLSVTLRTVAETA